VHIRRVDLPRPAKTADSRKSGTPDENPVQIGAEGTLRTSQVHAPRESMDEVAVGSRAAKLWHFEGSFAPILLRVVSAEEVAT
jgi:hypothetical protein